LQAAFKRAIIHLLFDGYLKRALDSLVILPRVLRPFASIQKFSDGAFHCIEKLRG
jgi:hypothetical protein